MALTSYIPDYHTSIFSDLFHFKRLWLTVITHWARISPLASFLDNIGDVEDSLTRAYELTYFWSALHLFAWMKAYLFVMVFFLILLELPHFFWVWFSFTLIDLWLVLNFFSIFGDIVSINWWKISCEHFVLFDDICRLAVDLQKKILLNIPKNRKKLWSTFCRISIRLSLGF